MVFRGFLPTVVAQLMEAPARPPIEYHFGADEYFFSIDSKNYRSYIFGSSSI